jgi:hypothetical protein
MGGADPDEREDQTQGIHRLRLRLGRNAQNDLAIVTIGRDNQGDRWTTSRWRDGDITTFEPRER